MGSHQLEVSLTFPEPTCTETKYSEEGSSPRSLTIRPLPATSRLWELPSVIITPHVAGQSARRIDDMTNFFRDNLRRFAVYTLVTSTGSWDTGRAITTSLALIALGPAILTTLRRAARRVVVTRVDPHTAAGSGLSRP